MLTRPQLYRAARTILCAIVLTCSPYAHAGQHIFRHFGTLDGLPGNSVTCAAEDKYGFVWIGTKAGLCQYDGKRFNRFELYGRGSFDSVNGLCNDADGNIWAASINGLARINVDTGDISRFNFASGESAREVRCDGEGNIWAVSGDGIRMMRRGSDELVRYDKGAYINAVRSCIDRSGQVWFTSSDGNMYRYSRSSDTFVPMGALPDRSIASGDYISHIIAIDMGRFLASTYHNEVFRLDPSSGTAEKIRLAEDSGFNGSVICLMEKDGIYYIGTDKGVFLYDSSLRPAGSIKHSPYDSFSISNDNVRCLFSDSTSRLWIGTFFSGINLMQARSAAVLRNLPDSDGPSLRQHRKGDMRQ